MPKSKFESVDPDNPTGHGGALYHIGLKKGDVGRIALMPGDPGRVPLIANHFKNAEKLAVNREYTSYGGYVGDEYVIAISTGIGSPSTGIAIEELARLGVTTMIRVGTCGAIQKEIRPGAVIIADAAVRLEGTSKQYIMAEYPAAANPETVIALKKSASKLGKNFEVGITASTDSFYGGQKRPGFNGYFPNNTKNLVEDLQKAKVLCFEMEASALFTIGRIYGINTGAVLAVVDNMVKKEFRLHAGIEDAIDIAIGAIKDL